MGKSKSSYKSKGQRPNVSRKTMRLMRRSREVTVDQLLARRENRIRVMVKPQSELEKKLAVKYRKQEEIESQAGILLNRFEKAGLTKAAAIQAVKTDYVFSLTQKWAPKLRSYLKSQKVEENRLNRLRFTGVNR